MGSQPQGEFDHLDGGVDTKPGFLIYSQVDWFDCSTPTHMFVWNDFLVSFQDPHESTFDKPPIPFSRVLPNFRFDLHVCCRKIPCWLLRKRQEFQLSVAMPIAGESPYTINRTTHLHPLSSIFDVETLAFQDNHGFSTSFCFPQGILQVSPLNIQVSTLRDPLRLEENSGGRLAVAELEAVLLNGG